MVASHCPKIIPQLLCMAYSGFYIRTPNYLSKIIFYCFQLHILISKLPTVHQMCLASISHPHESGCVPLITVYSSL